MRFFKKKENRLVKKTLRGDRDALQQLYEEHFEALYSFVYYRVGCDQHTAEDITQEVFLSMMDHLPNYKESKGSLYGWLCGIARHQIVDKFRSAKKMIPFTAMPETMDAEVQAIIEQIDTQPLPDEWLDHKEMKACVASAMTNLPSHYRQVLLKKYIEDISVREIAAGMELSEKAAESLLARAREAFKQVFNIMLKDNAVIGCMERINP